MNYEIRTTLLGNALVGITESGIEKWIPEDEANSDYQAYLEWVDAGGVAEVIEG